MEDTSTVNVPNENKTEISAINANQTMDTTSQLNNKNDDPSINTCLEHKIREIVRGEVKKSETRVLLEMNSKFEQLHSDLLDQFITNEISAEKHMEKIFQVLK